MNNKESLEEIINSYKWIKVERYNPDIIFHAEEEYRIKQLEKHHIEETEFLINKCRELAKELLNRL